MNTKCLFTLLSLEHFEEAWDVTILPCLGCRAVVKITFVKSKTSPRPGLVKSESKRSPKTFESNQNGVQEV